MEYPALDRMEALVNGLNAMQTELSSSLAEISQTQSEGVSDSGLVTVRASSDGAIVAVHLDPRAMRMDSQTLADEFHQAATRAQEAIAATTRERLQTLLTPLSRSDNHGPSHGH